MKTACTFEGTTRKEVGTGSARALRNEGKVPSVIYGSKDAPLHFSIDENLIKREYQKGGFFGKLVTLTIDGKAVYGIPKDIQMHPVNDHIMHVDFLKVEEGKDVKVLVPVIFLNADRCTGIRRGGTLNVVRYDLEVYCHPDAIPESVEVDLQPLNIGDSIHISHISLPEGVRPTITDRDFTIAAIAGRASKATREAEEAEEGEEGEGEEASEE